MNFFLITGPPAVGKMTVAKALSERLDYKMLHNHDSIELALKFFFYGDAEFKKINEGVRTLVFETTAKSRELNGMIFTLVWAFDEQSDWDYVDRIKKIYQDEGWKFYIVELYADLNTRLERNVEPDRLAAKPSKRNIELSNQNLKETEEIYQTSSGGDMVKDENYLLIDNTLLTPHAVVDQIISHFKLTSSKDS